MKAIARALIRVVSLTCLLAAAACGAGSEGTWKSQGASSSGACADDEGAADKAACAKDTDCDSDETCSAGLCKGLGDETDDDDDCERDDEGGADKITCAVDSDCDSDEVCNGGLCQ